MQMRLELVPLPVSDVDRSIAFYADKLGFKEDFDVQPSEGVRVVQLTPEGSGCSVVFGTGLDVYAGEPGSVKGLHLVAQDITEARAELVRRGGEISEIRDFVGGVKGADFSDPDGNNFELQEMSWRRGATYSELADCVQVGCGMNVPTVVIALKAAVSKAVGNEVDKVLAVALNVARQEAHAWFE